MNKNAPGILEFKRALYIPLLLLFLLWFIKFLEIFSGISFSSLGILPRKVHGLLGIIFAPLIHANFSHLMNNSVPLTLLLIALFYFYRPIAFRVLILVWLITGICVWIGGRKAYHIGASGVIYGIAAFLFFSGLIRRNIQLLSISLAIVFLYGGMVWGIFPFNSDISWESHLFGGLTGLTLSIVYSDVKVKHEKPKYEDSDDELLDSFPYWEMDDEEKEFPDKS